MIRDRKACLVRFIKPDIRDFLLAKLGSNPSFVWCSILESQALLKIGVALRVGNGITVDIKKDPWLPRVNDPYIHTVHDDITNQKVSYLMSTFNHNWDIDLVQDIFNDRDANLILSIPVRRAENDVWF